jgi:hypothetical protein
MNMKKLMNAALLTIGVAIGLSSSGCVMVTSSIPSSTAVTGEAWYTQLTGMFGMGWNPKVFYCPAPSSGPATCKEAKMVPLVEK